MDLVFAPEAWEDYLYWQRSDPAILSPVNLLIKEIMRDPYAGIGKPEPLKYAFQGYCHGGSLPSIELFTKKSGINSLSHSSAIIIGREPRN